MPAALKIALLFAGTWFGSLVVSLITTGIVAMATSHWGAQRVAGPMFSVMALDVVFALLGSFVLWRGLATSLSTTAPRVLLLLGHGVLQLATAAVVILMTLVAFNR
jgi:hypothetical protein